MTGGVLDPSRLKRRVTATLATLLLVVSAAGCLTPAPPSVDISVRNAAWVFEHPALGTHSSRGEYFLALNVSVRNTGDGDAIISAADFTVYWKGSTQGQPARLSPWVTMTIKWGMTATVTVGTNASSLLAPDRVELKFGTRPAVASLIPNPSSPPSDVLLTDITATWADAGFTGLPPNRGDTYMWVNATVRNQWRDQLKLSNANFWVAGTEGAAFAAVGFLGAVSVPPQRAVDIRLAFEVPIGWVATEFGYDMAVGPWTSAPFPLVSGTVAYYGGGLLVQGSSWSYTSPAGAHALPGDYYLYTYVTLSNTGLGILSSPVYTLEWTDGTRTSVADPRVPAANASISIELAFLASGIKTPRLLTAILAPGVSMNATVPPPTAAPVEVELLSPWLVWADANLDGRNPAVGKTFVWVDVTVRNAWTSYLALSISNFWLGLPDGTAIAAAAFSGPSTVPPLRKTSVRLSYEVAFSWSSAQLSYDMGAGPWTSVSLPAPQGSVKYYAGLLSVTNADWNFITATGAHTLPGDYILGLDIVLRNTAYGTFSGLAFSLQWADYTVSNVTDPRVITANQTLVLRLSFPATGLKAPRSLSATVAIDRILTAAIPPPASPPVEVVLKNLSSATADASLDGVPPAAGNEFIWVNASIVNRWTADISTTILSFALEGPNGSKVAAVNRTGPSAVGPGGVANLSLAFEVPAGFAPTTLHYSMLAGPWTNVSVPAPTRYVIYRSASLALASAAWSFESPSGTYAARGTQFLYVNASVVNTGLSTMSVSPLSFEAVWNGTGVAQAGAANWAPIFLPPGGSAGLLVAFLSLSPAAPDSVRLVVGSSPPTYAWKGLPAPSSPTPKFRFSNMTAAWNTSDLSGVNASGSNRFLVLRFDFVNQWSSGISLSATNFEVEGSGNATYGAHQCQGPASVGAGGRASITLVFEVPASWQPTWLHFNGLGGPWADAAIPPPV